MGAGRRMTTVDVDTRSQRDGAQQEFENMQRHLGERLAGCIFGCTQETQEECEQGQIFGLPKNHWVYVQYVKEGMPIFLFSYTTRKMHGIYKAACDGALNINPKGWQPNKFASLPTRYPAQVRVSVHHLCPALAEKDYKPILKDCYHFDGVKTIMRFELTQQETSNLCRAFAAAAGKPVAGMRPTPKTLQRKDEDGFSVVQGKRFVAAAAPANNAWGGKAKAAPCGLPAIDEGTSSAAAIDDKDPFGGAEEVPDYSQRSWQPPPDVEPFSQEVSQLGLEDMHDALHYVNPHTAYHVWSVIAGVGRLLDAATAERAQLSAVITDLQNQNTILVQEAHSLRQDLAFVGAQPNINVVVAAQSEGIMQLLATKHRVPQELYLLGGDYESVNNTSMRMDVVEAYATNAEAMRVLPGDEGARRVNSAAIGLGRSIYMCGGAFTDRTWLSSCIRLDVDVTSYNMIAPMKYPRGGFDGVVMDDKIYVVGGTGHNNVYHNHGEMYDPHLDVWVDLPKMAYRRFNCTVEQAQGSIFAVGGFNGNVYLTAVERYDPREGRWEEVTSMSTKRAAHLCEVLGHDIYAMGGYGNVSGNDTSTFLSSTEVYDVRGSGWRPAPNMVTPRAYGVSGVMDGYLYVLCGVDAVHAVPATKGLAHYNRTIQYLDVVQNIWVDVPWPLSSYSAGRAYAAAAVL